MASYFNDRIGSGVCPVNLLELRVGDRRRGFFKKGRFWILVWAVSLSSCGPTLTGLNDARVLEPGVSRFLFSGTVGRSTRNTSEILFEDKEQRRELAKTKNTENGSEGEADLSDLEIETSNAIGIMYRFGIVERLEIGLATQGVNGTWAADLQYQYLDFPFFAASLGIQYGDGAEGETVGIPFTFSGHFAEDSFAVYTTQKVTRSYAHIPEYHVLRGTLGSRKEILLHVNIWGVRFGKGSGFMLEYSQAKGIQNLFFLEQTSVGYFHNLD